MSKLFLVLLLWFLSTLVYAKKTGDVTELQIGVKYKPASCEIQAHKGDTLSVHYRRRLHVLLCCRDPTQMVVCVFDSSFEKGWEQGLLGMCVGEKRKLKILAKLGYGDPGSPPVIPGGATLIFNTELVSVNGQPSKGTEDVDEDIDDSEL